MEIKQHLSNKSQPYSTCDKLDCEHSYFQLFLSSLYSIRKTLCNILKLNIFYQTNGFCKIKTANPRKGAVEKPRALDLSMPWLMVSLSLHLLRCQNPKFIVT